MACGAMAPGCGYVHTPAEIPAMPGKYLAPRYRIEPDGPAYLRISALTRRKKEVSP